MENTIFPLGDPERINLIRTKPFDRGKAEILFAAEENINQPFLDEKGFSTTWLYEAMDRRNLAAVQFLFEKGADPNYCNEELVNSCPLWDLQYADAGTVETSYEIAKCFFKHGADPNLVCEGDALYDFVVYRVYNDPDPVEFECLLSFYKLLILYGGGGVGYAKPRFIKPVHAERADDYRIAFRQSGDSYHIKGFLVDETGEYAARL